ncbi:MAG: phosphoribosylanthranilate isomerase [Ekhidna sp.]|nr:phosphoribosylanthranilate isomerase [Ekhidna sp.]
MSRLKLKVCGMRDPDNLRGLIKLQPDFIGFIFYDKSPRYVNSIDKDVLLHIPSGIKKVGVFVNESELKVLEIVEKYKLDFVQLHGDEGLQFAQGLRSKGVKIIKVFRLRDSVPKAAQKYEDIASYLLFDTSTSNFGGSGKHFDWNILKDYVFSVPFLLSGGIQHSDIKKIKSMKISQLVGIDVNSKFEIEPGLKDLELVKISKVLL